MSVGLGIGTRDGATTTTVGQSTLMTGDEAARILQRSVRSLHHAASRGHLRANRIGRGRIFFHRNEIEAMARNLGLLS